MDGLNKYSYAHTALIQQLNITTTGWRTTGCVILLCCFATTELLQK
jgi:hypothetical protein